MIIHRDTPIRDITEGHDILLRVISISVPLRGQMYLDKNSKIQICRQNRQFSKRSKKKPILEWR